MGTISNLSAACMLAQLLFWCGRQAMVQPRHCQCSTPALSWVCMHCTGQHPHARQASACLDTPDGVPCHLLTSLSRSTSFMSPKKACRTNMHGCQQLLRVLCSS